MSQHELVVKRISQQFPDLIEEVVDFRGERTLIIPQEKIVAVCTFLRDDPQLQYNFLTDICADDMLPDYPRFAVNYMLYSIPAQPPDPPASAG
jgi:NADH-quinone oxidoreductase subunit C